MIKTMCFMRQNQKWSSSPLITVWLFRRFYLVEYNYRWIVFFWLMKIFVKTLFMIFMLMWLLHKAAKRIFFDWIKNLKIGRSIRLIRSNWTQKCVDCTGILNSYGESPSTFLNRPLLTLLTLLTHWTHCIACNKDGKLVLYNKHELQICNWPWFTRFTPFTSDSFDVISMSYMS